MMTQISMAAAVRQTSIRNLYLDLTNMQEELPETLVTTICHPDIAHVRTMIHAATLC